MYVFRLINILRVLLWQRLDVYLVNEGRRHWLERILDILFFLRAPLPQRAVRLRLTLEALGPIFVKFGQMLSTRRDLLPPDVAEELVKLQDNVPPCHFEQVQATIEQAFGQPLSAIYSHFDAMPVASASVAQVHFAILHNQQKVAVKVLRPNIARVIQQDIAIFRILAWWLNILSREGRRLKPQEIVDEFARHITQELDLMLEAAHCTQLARNFSDQRLLIPTVYWDFCRSQVMTMQRMGGVSIRDKDSLIAHGIDLTLLAHQGVELFFTQVFRDSFFHADMHPGNIRVMTDGENKGKLVLLDFGIVGSLTQTDQYYLARNFLAFFNRDYRDVAVAHIESGWVPPHTKVEELENAVRAICEPIFNKPLKEISFGRTLLSLFQMSRRFGVNIQPQLIMLQKTLLNIEGLGRELDPDIDLWQSAKPFLKRWMSEQVGWGSVLKSLKNELPKFLIQAPQMPRLWHTFLTQQTQAAQQNQTTIAQLLAKQHQQNQWLKWTTIGVIVLALLQLASLVIIMME